MAKFLKVPLATGDELIGISNIINVHAGDAAAPPANLTTRTTIVTDGIAGAQTFVIVHTAALVGGPTVLQAFNAALTANPGGIVSTLGSPVAVAQVPQQPSISGATGRTVVTTPAVFVAYASVAIA